MTAPTKFVPDADTRTNRTVLVEHVTNPHIGRKRGERWRAWTEGGAMVFQALQTHFPRDRVVLIGYHGAAPRPVGITNALSPPGSSPSARPTRISAVRVIPDPFTAWRMSASVPEMNRSSGQLTR